MLKARHTPLRRGTWKASLPSSFQKNSKSVPLPGSEKKKLEGAKQIGDVDPKEPIDVSVIIRQNPSAPEAHPDELGSLPPKKRNHLTREQFAAQRGASQEDLKKVQEFATQYGLKVKEVNAARRSVVLSGTAPQLQKAFGVQLKKFKHPKTGETFRGREGAIYVPSSLSGVVEAVLGLDDRPQVSPHFRLFRQKQISGISYSASQVAKIYDFPSGLDGTGECIGIIEFGGGYAQSDLTTYFQGTPPSIVSVSVDGGSNSPTGDPNGPDGEVMLDIEVAGSIAPKAKVAMYFAPNNDRGFVDAISTAINDAQNKPSVVSISWGGAESTWTAQSLQAVNQAIEDASTMGVTVCCAAGDNGSSDGVSDGLAHVDFPASSPYALACGGTRLTANSGGTISSEVVWNDGPGGGATGGGISDAFDLPSWQNGFKVPPSVNPGGRVGRGVPDVAGDADPQTGYSVRVDGQSSVVGGTSAVAPLWAGLITLINQKLGRSVGYLNPLIYELYSENSSEFHDITSGNNGAYSAGPGWDACTGLGSPDGSDVLSDIASAS